MKTDRELEELLHELHQEGVRNDNEVESKSQMMLNITPATGRFLSLLVDELAPAKILEVGTSNGYSTIWLARAAKRVGASIDTIDKDPEKVRKAAANLSEAGFADVVTIKMMDAGRFFPSCPKEHYDFVFLDSARLKYCDWMDDLLSVIRFGTLVVDNAVSHADELSEFVHAIDQVEHLNWVTLPIGKGQMVINAQR